VGAGGPMAIGELECEGQYYLFGKGDRDAPKYGEAKCG